MKGFGSCKYYNFLDKYCVIKSLNIFSFLDYEIYWKFKYGITHIISKVRDCLFLLRIIAALMIPGTASLHN